MTKRVKKILPPYVMMGDTAFRLITGEKSKYDYYYRDAGAWSIKCKWIGDELYSVNQYGRDMKYLGGHKLIECTYDEWRKNNGEYASGIKDKSKSEYVLLIEERISEYNKLLNVTKQGMDYYELNGKIVEVLQDLLSDMKHIENKQTDNDIPF